MLQGPKRRRPERAPGTKRKRPGGSSKGKRRREGDDETDEVTKGDVD